MNDEWIANNAMFFVMKQVLLPEIHHRNVIVYCGIYRALLVFHHVFELEWTTLEDILLTSIHNEILLYVIELKRK